jgi:hypothetical protein
MLREAATGMPDVDAVWARLSRSGNLQFHLILIAIKYHDSHAQPQHVIFARAIVHPIYLFLNSYFLTRRKFVSCLHLNRTLTLIVATASRTTIKINETCPGSSRSDRHGGEGAHRPPASTAIPRCSLSAVLHTIRALWSCVLARDTEARGAGSLRLSHEPLAATVIATTSTGGLPRFGFRRERP